MSREGTGNARAAVVEVSWFDAGAQRQVAALDAVAGVAFEDGVATSESDDAAVALRAVGALRRLAEQVEARGVRLARERGWSWEQIGDALGVFRQSIHAKYGKREQ